MSESTTTASAMVEPAGFRSPLALEAIYYATAIGFALYMFYYYWTSAGGPVILAVTMVPVTYILFTLQALRTDQLYPYLPRWLNYMIAGAYCAFAVYCAWYMRTNYRALGEERAGIPNFQDC